MKEYNNHGELRDTAVRGPIVTLMFSRPTSDRDFTNLINVDMLCVDEDQAILVERKHRLMWRLPLVDRTAEEATMEALEDLLG